MQIIIIIASEFWHVLTIRRWARSTTTLCFKNMPLNFTITSATVDHFHDFFTVKPMCKKTSYRKQIAHQLSCHRSKNKKWWPTFFLSHGVYWFSLWVGGACRRKVNRQNVTAAGCPLCVCFVLLLRIFRRLSFFVLIKGLDRYFSANFGPINLICNHFV